MLSWQCCSIPHVISKRRPFLAYTRPVMFGWLVELLAELGKMLLPCYAMRDAVAKVDGSAVANLAQVRRGIPKSCDAWVGRGHAPLPLNGGVRQAYTSPHEF